jgi:hypothetical protein
MLIDRPLFSEDIGGMGMASFTTYGLTLNAMVDVAGAFFGPAGVSGAYWQRSSHLNLFSTYMQLKIPASLLAVALDIKPLYGCELWQTNPALARETYGWTPAIYKAARMDGCYYLYVDFIIRFTLSFGLLVYVASGIKRFADRMDDEPKYVLRPGKADGAFRASMLPPNVGAYGAAPLLGAPVMVRPPMVPSPMGPPMGPPMMPPMGPPMMPPMGPPMMPPMRPPMMPPTMGPPMMPPAMGPPMMPPAIGPPMMPPAMGPPMMQPMPPMIPM